MEWEPPSRSAYQRSSEGELERFGGVEEGFVDRAWVGCEKRRLWSPRGDDVPLEMAVGDGDAAVGAAAVSGASDGSEVKGFGDEVSGDDNEFIAGLMRRLGLGAR